MTPWRSNQLYQGPKMHSLSTAETNSHRHPEDDNISIDSGHEACTGGFEIELYPSLTSLDEISQPYTSSSTGSLGRISGFLNNLFKRRNKKRKIPKEDLKRTTSLPQDLSQLDWKTPTDTCNSPAIPPRSVSLEVTKSSIGSSNCVKTTKTPRRKSESNLRKTNLGTLETKKVKRRAPLPPTTSSASMSSTSNFQSKPLFSQNVNCVVSISDSKISQKNRDIETKWQNQVKHKLCISKIETNIEKSVPVFRPSDLCSQSNVGKKELPQPNLVKRRKKRLAPLPPSKSLDTLNNNTSTKGNSNGAQPKDGHTFQTANTRTKHLLTTVPVSNNTDLDIYATWPKNQDAIGLSNTEISMSMSRASTIRKRWSYGNSKFVCQDRELDSLFKIYIPIVSDQRTGPKESPKVINNWNSNVAPPNGDLIMQDCKAVPMPVEADILQTSNTNSKKPTSDRGNKFSPLQAAQKMEVAGNAAFRNTSNNSVKRMTAKYDGMCGAEMQVKSPGKSQNSKSKCHYSIDGKNDFSGKEHKGIPVKTNEKPHQKKSYSQVSDSNKDDRVKLDSKPPSVPQSQGPRRRKGRKRDYTTNRKRLSPLFEVNLDKNTLEKEIDELLKDVHPIPEEPNKSAEDEMDASPNSVHINRLFRRLSQAISNGHYERAAIFARQLAMLKAQCITSNLAQPPLNAAFRQNGSRRQSESAKPEDVIIPVSLFIEDKDTHHGPIPLNLSPKMTLRLLKKMVEYHFGFPVANQRWILGKALATEDNVTLAEFGVTSGCALFLYLVNEPPSPIVQRKVHRQRAGPSPSEPAGERDAALALTKQALSDAKDAKLNGDFQDQEKHLEIGSIDNESNGKVRLEKPPDISNGARPKIFLRKESSVETQPMVTEPPVDTMPKDINLEVKLKRLAVTNEAVEADHEIILKDINPALKLDTEHEYEEDVSPSQSEGESTTEDDEDNEDDDNEQEDEATPPLIPQLPKSFIKSNSIDSIEVVSEKSEDGVIGATGFDQSKVESRTPVVENETKGQDLLKLMEEQEKLDLIPNCDEFECIVCLTDIPPGEGVVLRECLHRFCRECLANAVEYCQDAVVKCPYMDNSFSCTSHLLDRELKNLVSPKVYEKHLQRSIQKAESQDSRSFHCKTPNCSGWCFFEDNVNVFDCPVCHKQNCLTCQAIHPGKNCLQHQEEVEFQESIDDDIKKTKKFLNSMIVEGTAMRCPKCQVVVLKKWGCDWLKCCVCDTEICWVTKGPRWGPGGRGDTSGGCRCRVNGLKCHPLCQYCH